MLLVINNVCGIYRVFARQAHLQSHVIPTQTITTQITADTPIIATRIITTNHRHC